jgi:hypothetical protein
MAGLKLQAFAGIVPKRSAQLLQDNEAQIASNTKLHSGEIRSWRRPGSVYPKQIPPYTPLSIYRMNNTSGDSIWLSWPDVVDVVLGPVYDVGSPIYYTGNGLPKKTNAVMAESDPENTENYLLMGVPTPTSAPTVTSTGGSGVAETRTYLFTHLSEFGAIVEESAPSPTSALVTVNPGSTTVVSGLPSAAPAGKYNITKVRVYRSVTGTNSTTFLQVTDLPIGTTSFTDNVTAAQLGGVLPSTTWSPPPDDLSGIVGMANGIMAGFVGNQIYFCEPFMPHAWPAAYALSVEFPIVGLAAYGSSLVVATKGNPFIITGSSPAAMSQEKLPLYEPCVSKRSIASDEQGAMYASPNGIIKIGPGIADNVARNLFTRDEWATYMPNSMIGEVHDGRYFLFYSYPNGSGGGLILDRNNAASPLTTTNELVTATHADPVNANLFVVTGNEIKGWDSDPVNDLHYEWKSKPFTMPRPVNFGAAQIGGNFGSINAAKRLQELLAYLTSVNQGIWNSAQGLMGALGTQGVNETVTGGSRMIPLPDAAEDRFVLLSVYGDGVLRAQIKVTNGKPFRLPSGFKAIQWEFVVNGNVDIQYMKIAETSKELVNI